jgi:glucosyl-dolichyl phosphate glucuronosyltransferase
VLTVTVVIPCFTEKRWPGLLRAIRSAQDQTYGCDLIVVVDHNEALAQRLRDELGDTARVMPNRFPQGASGARNTGAFAATTDLVAFLEDDAYAEATWVEALVRGHERAPHAVGLGGTITPLWADGAPRWFPTEFSWTLGGTFAHPGDTDVRNVWGGNMLVERRAFAAVGGFATGFGKLGNASQPEDTELCVRMNAAAGRGAQWRFIPDAVVFHEVSAERSTPAFFVKRCWSEGKGKAAMAALSPSGAAVLDEESRFLRTVVIRGIVRNLWAAVRGDASGLARALAIVVGTLATGSSYLLAKAAPRRTGRTPVRAAGTPDTGDAPEQGGDALVVGIHDAAARYGGGSDDRPGIGTRAAGA